VTASEKRIELWCDSFHEGTWAAEGLISQWPLKDVQRTNPLGFVPEYSIELSDGVRLRLTVFGGYQNWTDLPPKIQELLSWGKPDVIAYDRDADRLLFAVEETAAVPTGNQALQRCERMHGASKLEVPFWYLLAQFGTHLDTGIRQASPWPALMAVALTATFRLPNLVLLYASLEAPEDYAAGTGMGQLFQVLSKLLFDVAHGGNSLSHLEEDLTEQFQSMLQFIGATYANVTDVLPGRDLLFDKETARLLARIATGVDREAASFPLLEWPSFSELPETVQKSQKAGTLIKHDPFLFALELGRSEKWCYTLSSNSGSRPQHAKSLGEWIDQQHNLHRRAEPLVPAPPFNVMLSDFPESTSGLRHVTTAKNVLYLADDIQVVFDALGRAFPRTKGNLRDSSGRGAMVYISNSVLPGRVFGDPYTGQFAAFSWVFGGTEAKPRVKIAYFPHQSHGLMRADRSSSNKGKQLFLDRADYLIFLSGAVLDVGANRWI
jgi:hypothetical protein